MAKDEINRWQRIMFFICFSVRFAQLLFNCGSDLIEQRKQIKFDLSPDDLV